MRCDHGVERHRPSGQAAVRDGRFRMMGLRYGSGRLKVITPRHLVTPRASSGREGRRVRASAHAARVVALVLASAWSRAQAPPAPDTAPLPDISVVFSEVLENQERVDATREAYTYTMTVTDLKSEGQGVATEGKANTYEVFRARSQSYPGLEVGRRGDGARLAPGSMPDATHGWPPCTPSLR